MRTAVALFSLAAMLALGGAPAAAEMGPPPSATMAGVEVPVFLRYLVRAETDRRASSVSLACERTGEAAFSCRAAFETNGVHFKGWFEVSKYYGSDGVLYWTGTFTGRKPATGARVRWSV